MTDDKGRMADDGWQLRLTGDRCCDRQGLLEPTSREGAVGRSTRYCTADYQTTLHMLILGGRLVSPARHGDL